MGEIEDSEILIHPRKGKLEKEIPEHCILFVNPSEAEYCHKQLRLVGGEARSLFNSGMTIASGGLFAVAGPAIGSPMAVMTLEKLIALGAKNIILFGWCGAIDKAFKIGDVILPHQASSGEGTSTYYPIAGNPVTSAILRAKLQENLETRSFRTRPGVIWSTDAVYRENRLTLKKLNNLNHVVAIDMEFSALCTVSCFRKIDFAAIMIVSDELWTKKWNPGFSKEKFLTTKTQILNILLEERGIFNG